MSREAMIKTDVHEHLWSERLGDPVGEHAHHPAVAA